MEINYENKIRELEEKIKVLEANYAKMTSQSTFPIEIEDALKARGFLQYKSSLFLMSLNGGNRTYKSILVEHNNETELISASNNYKEFYVTTADDVCHSLNHGYIDETQVFLYSSGELPTGLGLATSYYVKNATTNTFQLSSNGTDIDDITSEGSGTHYAEFYTYLV